MSLDLSNDPHRRYNPLTGEWIQVSPHRAKRPWQGKQEETPGEQKPKYDRECYLCPGNDRAGDARNPDYDSTFVFTNDFSALKPETPSESLNTSDLLIAQGEKGICRVICFSPRHDLTLPEMALPQIREVVDLWVEEYTQLGSREYINYVQIFENKGEIMGCSNPHPHGQIWAQQTIPDQPAKELKQQTQYYEEHGQTLLGDYLDLELERGTRVIVENDHFVVVVPYWAFWPFETLLISRRPFARFTDMSREEKEALADITKQLTVRYDNLFEVSFPYSAGFHPAPTDGNGYPQWHFHQHYYPPLLRSATIKKFRVGYEMLGTPQRDMTPEASAALLQEVSPVHYNER
ncbi:UDP-glucose--hexose-1-phosphate uridylyltransferase [Aliifodinibius salicampi]|uniref:Galactose-1-phosphate uridylyltransferase n=1 Tax=Fodinibius salicampi TaxID=1920655 RepID=A0ABT3PVI9_9BACT|nr:UDP-glucose--hexose-1-phosphate uridylyltransferase [Fodinibius salicampi]MCW9711879.1 UDP-glucose--hexose-1-phosphate uridylyltransferase [Fodinibius salicampi]